MADTQNIELRREMNAVTDAQFTIFRIYFCATIRAKGRTNTECKEKDRKDAEVPSHDTHLYTIGYTMNVLSVQMNVVLIHYVAVFDLCIYLESSCYSPFSSALRLLLLRILLLL